MSIKERKEKERQKRIEVIQNAALSLFVSRGFDNTSMEMIADRADFAKAGIYHYFKSKNEIFFSIIKSSFNLYLENLINIIDQSKDLSEAISNLIDFNFAFQNDNKEISLLKFDLRSNVLDIHLEKYAKDIIPLYEKYYVFLKEYFTMQLNKENIKDVDVDTLIHSITGMVENILRVDYFSKKYLNKSTINDSTVPTLKNILFKGIFGK